MRKKDRKKRILEIRQIQKIKHERKKWMDEKYDFKYEYCSKLVDHCSRGYSFESFADEIKIMPETLEEWTEEYPEFKKARSFAAYKWKIFWEKKVVEACKEKFSLNLFRYLVGSKDEKPAVANPVVMIPKEENSK